MARSPIPRLHRLCLSLPEATEVETWGQPTFRVRGRIFAMLHDSAHGPGLWFKAPRGSQDVLVEAASDRFFRPPCLGPKGWVGLRMTGAPDWAEIEALVRRSYSLIAPKRLAVEAAPPEG